MTNQSTHASSALIIAMLAITTGPQTFAQETQPEEGRLHVSGSGEVKAKPDIARINVGVVTDAESAEQAVSDNNQAMQKLMQQLKKHEIADKDVQTSSFDVSPIYERDNSRSERNDIAGYRVSNQVQVVVRKLPAMGKVLDDVVGAGANRIHGIRFMVEERKALIDKARRMAVNDAHRKAELMAETAGAKLGRVLQINENSTGGPRPVEYQAARTAAADKVPIASGRQTLRANVSMTYELLAKQEDANGSAAP